MIFIMWIISHFSRFLVLCALLFVRVFGSFTVHLLMGIVVNAILAFSTHKHCFTVLICRLF